VEAANPTSLPPRDFRQEMEQGFHNGLAARKKAFEFWQHYWHVILIGAIVVAGAASLKGALPGTRKIKIAEPPPMPPSPILPPPLPPVV